MKSAMKLNGVRWGKETRDRWEPAQIEFRMHVLLINSDNVQLGTKLLLELQAVGVLWVQLQGLGDLHNSTGQK